MAELRTVAPPPQPDYSVTVGAGDAIIVKEALVEQWSSKGEYKAEVEKLVAKHNEIYNKRGLKRGSESSNTSNQDRPAKRLCVTSEPVPLDEFESKTTDRCGLKKHVSYFKNSFKL